MAEPFDLGTLVVQCRHTDFCWEANLHSSPSGFEVGGAHTESTQAATSPVRQLSSILVVFAPPIRKTRARIAHLRPCFNLSSYPASLCFEYQE